MELIDSRKKLKLGVIADEFFDQRIGRMGGFGWATKQVARCFDDPALNVEIVFLTAELPATEGRDEELVHGKRLILKRRSKLENILKIRAERIDLMLTIDYSFHFRFFFNIMPFTPVIVWARDPRSPADYEVLRSLRQPEQLDVEPGGNTPLDCTSLSGVIKSSKFLGRPVLLAVTSPHLLPRLPGTYGIDSDMPVHQLPNIIDLAPAIVTKSLHPQVVFLGRLDPVKRPWLFIELARRYPQIEFLTMGAINFTGNGAWQPPTSLPPNLKMLGHIDGEEKSKILSSAWALVNTSIHEGLAVSFLEALQCETPIISTVNPENLVSDYGHFCGKFNGTGIDALPEFEKALERMLADPQLWLQRGKEGRKWVERVHTRDTFLTAFRRLCALARVQQPAYATHARTKEEAPV